MSLIRDDKPNGLKQHKAKMVVETQSFKDTFGPKAQRKRVKLGLSNFDDLVGHSEKAHDTYTERLEEAKLLSGRSKEEGNGDDEGGAADWNYGTATLSKEAIFSKGQSKRIWNELYKVLDSSDVVLHVLDARDPLGTRCRAVEKYLKEEAPHKHLVFILNKCDLVPTKVAVSSHPSLYIAHHHSLPSSMEAQDPTVKSRLLLALTRPIHHERNLLQPWESNRRSAALLLPLAKLVRGRVGQTSLVLRSLSTGSRWCFV
jgi:hypothetical protein